MTAKAPEPICPKCGYDQSGEIATWETQCPVHGRCTECAYEFQWANILDPSRIDLLWYVEHARRKRDIPYKSLRTFWRLLFPNAFWREVGVHTRIRYRTLLLWLLLILIVLHTLALFPVAMGHWHEQWGMMGTGGFREFSSHGYAAYLFELHNAVISPFLRIQYGYYGFGYRLGGYYNDELHAAMLICGFVTAQSLMWLIITWVLPITRARSSLRVAHLIRAFLITLIPAIFFFEFVRVITGLYNWMPASPMMNWIPFVFLALMALTLIWLYWFWIAAMKIGWGIKPVWHIAILGSIAALLTGAIIFVFEAP